MSEQKGFYLGYIVPNGGGALLPVKFFEGADHDDMKAKGDFQEVTQAQIDAFADSCKVVGAALRNERLVLVDRLPKELQDQITLFIDENGTGF